MAQINPNLSRAWRRTFWHVYDNLGLLIAINILWLLCSITVIGLPAATTALFYIAYLIVLDKSVKFNNFFVFLLKYFFISTFITLILCIGYLFLLFNIRFYLHHFGIIGAIFGGTSFWLFIFFLLILIYIFPLMCRYNNFLRILKYCFILTMDNLKTTLILFFTTIVFLGLEIIIPIISLAILAIFIQNAFLEIESRYNSEIEIKEPRRNFREIWKMWNFSK